MCVVSSRSVCVVAVLVVKVFGTAEELMKMKVISVELLSDKNTCCFFFCPSLLSNLWTRT